MSTAVTFDTLKFVERLKKSGIPEHQAKAISKAFVAAHSDVATKSDVKRVEEKLVHSMQQMESRIIIRLGMIVTVATGLIVTLGKII